MKNLKCILLLIAVITLFVYCKKNNEDPNVDINSEETTSAELKKGKQHYEAELVEINELLDEIISSFANQDAPTLISMLSDDVIVLGSAPEQVFNKEEISAAWTYVLDQSALYLDPLTDRQIVISSNCKTATAVEQFNMPDAYANITFRNAYHLIKERNSWKILCWNSGIVMSDEDLAKVNDMLGE